MFLTSVISVILLAVMYYFNVNVEIATCIIFGIMSISNISMYTSFSNAMNGNKTSILRVKSVLNRPNMTEFLQKMNVYIDFFLVLAITLFVYYLTGYHAAVAIMLVYAATRYQSMVSAKRTIEMIKLGKI